MKLLLIAGGIGSSLDVRRRSELMVETCDKVMAEYREELAKSS